MKKKIVLGIRGTSSLADIITDAVVHPDNIDDWVPKDFKQVGYTRFAAPSCVFSLLP